MKNLILLFGLTLFSFSSFAQSKIGTIDAEFIVSQMPEMTEISEGLKTYNTSLQSDLDNTIKKYEGLVKSYQEENASFTEEDRKTKESEIISLENEIKGFRQKATLMIQMKRNELTDPLYQKVNTAMMEVISEEGFTQIFHAGGNAIAFSAEGYDITEKVMQKLGLEIQQQQN